MIRMHQGLGVAALASGYIALSCTTPAFAVDTIGHTLFDGVWQVTSATAVTGGALINGHRETMAPTDGSPLPLQPWNQALHEGFLEQSKQQIEWAPNNQHCLVAGTVRAMKSNYAWRWMTTPEAVVLLFEEDNRINLLRFQDAHAANLKSSWAGDAIARWDGDALVVDVTGFNGKTPFPLAIYHTTLLHVVHHFKLTHEGAQLEDRVAIDDPGAFTRPFEIVSVFNRQPDDYKLADYRCAENNLDLPQPMGWWRADWGPG
jgi:hypothetical protein